MPATNGREKHWRVALLRVQNIMGIASAEIRPGALTMVEGGNEQGKTSLFEAALAGLVGGGSPAKLLRKGEDEGSIVYLLDDGSGPPLLEIKTTIKPDSIKKGIRVVGEPLMKQEATVLDGIRNKASMFPVGLLTGKKEERVETLLKAIPLKVGKEDLAAVLPLCDKPREIDLDRHAFKVLDEIEKNLRAKRTGINAVVEQNRKTALGLKNSLLEGLTEGNNGQQRLDIVAGELEDWRNACQVEDAALRARLQDIKDSANRDYEDVLQKASKARDERIQAVRDAHDQKTAELQELRATRQQELATAVAKAETFVTGYRQAEASRKMILDLSTAADAKEEESKALTEAIHVDLPELRASLLEHVPIKGVSIMDGDVAIANKQGVPMSWDACNTATRVGVAVDVALLTAGPLRWFCGDGFECLDQEHLEALRETMVARKAQAFVTRVTSGPLTVTT